jgi:hypothetical protein
MLAFKKEKIDEIITKENGSLRRYEFYVKERENSSYYVDSVMSN